ncbi:MAG: DUF4917 family protein [Magnetococcales bacterium]|nr:DUF4917 family protein [Magnetococcales bacterium]
MAETTEILTFKQALEAANGKKHLLLGNGFSIALKPDIFSYDALFDKADFSASPHAREVFNALEIRDFEAVIRLLVDMAKALRAYPVAKQTLIDQINKDADAIKDILVNAVAGNHPDHPFQVSDKQMACCRRFLSHFEHKYTLNYDLLLYWAVMRDGNDQLDLHPDDGFRHPEDDEGADYVTWQEGNKATIHYLHGALHRPST